MNARYFCEWGCHEHVADLTAERDRARDIAVQLEQELDCARDDEATS